ncbi:hypothetical protein F5146DRAFT_998902 [Armillaria mellea]|nr:hypothetical protein F5146DRAFT_998902 [Armillaria mellea]
MAVHQEKLYAYGQLKHFENIAVEILGPSVAEQEKNGPGPGTGVVLMTVIRVAVFPWSAQQVRAVKGLPGYSRHSLPGQSKTSQQIRLLFFKQSLISVVVPTFPKCRQEFSTRYAEQLNLRKPSGDFLSERFVSADATLNANQILQQDWRYQALTHILEIVPPHQSVISSAARQAAPLPNYYVLRRTTIRIRLRDQLAALEKRSHAYGSEKTAPAQRIRRNQLRETTLLAYQSSSSTAPVKHSSSTSSHNIPSSGILMLGISGQKCEGSRGLVRPREVAQDLTRFDEGGKPQ